MGSKATGYTVVSLAMDEYRNFESWEHGGKIHTDGNEMIGQRLLTSVFAL